MLYDAGLSQKESFLIRLKFPYGATADKILKFAYNEELRKHILKSINIIEKTTDKVDN